MFIIKPLEISETINYPKYTLITNCEYVDYPDIFYYIVCRDLSINNVANVSPIKFLVTLTLNSNFLIKKNIKFNLSKLGTDYLINEIGLHFKSECIGSYPKNYIFVIEPHWPKYTEHQTDRTPLKANKLKCL